MPLKMQNGVQATQFALTVMAKAQILAILQLVIIVRCFLKLVVKSQICYLIELL